MKCLGKGEELGGVLSVPVASTRPPLCQVPKVQALAERTKMTTKPHFSPPKYNGSGNSRNLVPPTRDMYSVFCRHL